MALNSVLGQTDRRNHYEWIFSSVFGLIGLTLLLVGCPLLAVAAGMYYFVDSASRNWVLVPATVTGLNISQSYNSDTGTYHDTYCPYVKFTTNTGEEMEVLSNECSAPPAYATGDTLEVYHDPQEPHNVQIKGGVLQVVGNMFVIVLGSLGVLFSLAGLGLGIFGIIAALWKSRN